MRHPDERLVLIAWLAVSISIALPVVARLQLSWPWTLVVVVPATIAVLAAAGLILGRIGWILFVVMESRFRRPK